VGAQLSCQKTNHERHRLCSKWFTPAMSFMLAPLFQQYAYYIVRRLALNVGSGSWRLYLEDDNPLSCRGAPSHPFSIFLPLSAGGPDGHLTRAWLVLWKDRGCGMHLFCLSFWSGKAGGGTAWATLIARLRAERDAARCACRHASPCLGSRRSAATGGVDGRWNWALCSHGGGDHALADALSASPPACFFARGCSSTRAGIAACKESGAWFLPG